ncbi:CDGSH iron-sulfur domain-containing protein [Loktanella sp. Alg231-35]|uniref:CDGSH iron-sulfur domain-containing protein n=1 Tax=Loktanella sp. Alg231-35 TaxID=1922220 RepID=UPI000D54B35A|nr:CDGSH iron-sulfur domain-containing protein [Loktanella sp. Alg231-35]
MTAHPKITPIENGPLMVTNAPNLRDAVGETIESGEKMALCRCGLSAKKPFCDGSHNAAGFSSTSDKSKIRNTPLSYTGTVDGMDVTVHYTPVLCSHAAECVRASGAVFDPSRKPWIVPENGNMAELLVAMSKCPSGALRLEVATTAPQHMVDGETDMQIERHGPYRIKNVALDADFNGAGASQTKYVLCRCGHSKNKPFCDGSHRDEGWRDGSE